MIKRSALAIGAALALSAASMANAASPRIVNGVETAEHPAVGALLRTDGGYVVTQHRNRLECTGVLIGCRTVLTAAHCVGFPRLSGFAFYLQHAGFLAVSDIRVHPDYDGDSPEHNLAIVELAEPVEGIEPVALNSTHDLDAIETGLAGTIVGFGRPGGDRFDWNYDLGIKRTGKVVTASCDEDFDGLGDDAIVCWDFVAPLGEPGEDSNSCDGDAGGPLLIDFSGSVELAGVIHGESRSDCLEGSQGIGPRVDLHASWLVEQLLGDSTAICGEGAPLGTTLTPVVEKHGTLGPANPRRFFRFPVRDDTNRILVTFNGSDDGDFDADLYVKKNGEASPTDFDCSATGESLFGACELLEPEPGFLSVLLVARGGYGGNFQLTVVQNNEAAPVCGNAKHELGELCDGAEPGECATGPCSPECTCPAPICGNAVLEDGEDCDDGNTTPGDGCDASCVPETPDGCEDAPLLELGHGAWKTRGNTTGLGNDYVGCGSKAGDAWYRFSIDEPAALSAQVDAAFDTALSVYRGDCDGYFFHTCDFDDGPGPTSAIAGRTLEAGSYLLIVDGGPAEPEGPFELAILLAPTGCGNDVVDTSLNESCDGLDSGFCDNAACSPDCRCQDAVCGNGIREYPESCDGTDLGGCAGGPCGDNCKCPAPVCGNDVSEPGEECDGMSTGWCGDFGILCTGDCKCDYDTCGNDMREGWEACDGTDLGYCSIGPCDGCACPDPYCGNDVREAFEACDGEDLGWCSYGPCAGDCTCGPAVCGNGIREGFEQCDGSQIQGCDIGPCTDKCKCPAPVCGNGDREDGERCDGSDDDLCPVGPCQDDCECPSAVCGNGIRETSEECDGTIEDRCAVGSCQGDCTCPDPVCGNGILEESEQCDTANLNGCRRGPCEPDCKCPPPECGNEILESGEDCDGSKLGFCQIGPCQSDCTCPDPVCGNGVREIDEACDGQNTFYCGSDSCEDDCTCTPTVCGNGVRESPEHCDGADQGYCVAGPCQENCTCPSPVCGNNIREGNESCDGSGTTYCVAGPCDPDCTCPAPVCGNDILEQGESCDATKLGSCLTGPCGPDCKCPLPVCGNNIREIGESCDGTKTGSCPVNPCNPDCTCPDPVCGNYVLEGDEECDGFRLGSCTHGPCQQDCTCPPPVCGDGIWEPPTELCDGEHGGYCDAGICTQDCTCPGPECGNDLREGTEQCDGEDSYCYLGCEDDCTCSPYCGDDIVSGDEECDGYFSFECPSGACNENDCTCIAPECGDLVVQGEEQCDGSNLGDCPLGPCRSNCRCPQPICGNGVLESLESCEVDEPGVCGNRPCDEEDCTCSVGPICQSSIGLPAELDDYEVEGTTTEASSASVGCGGDGGDRWYRFDVARYSILEASTDGGFDSYLSLFAGSCTSLAFVDCDDDSGESVGSRIGPITLKPGSYVLVIDGHGPDEGDFTLAVDLEAWACGDADDNGSVTASDALRVLRKAVGHSQVCPITRCDASGDREIAASDALVVLRSSVGVAVDLFCPMQL